MGKHVHLLTRMPHSGIQIPCHKHNLKSIHADYIYRIISSKKQKGKPYEMDLPLMKNDITTIVRL